MNVVIKADKMFISSDRTVDLMDRQISDLLLVPHVQVGGLNSKGDEQPIISQHRSVLVKLYVFTAAGEF